MVGDSNYLVKSRLAMVQQIARLAQSSYFFYVSGKYPDEWPWSRIEEKDREIVEKYETDLTKYVNYRRAQGGAAKVRYLRCGRRFFLMATRGRHNFFEWEQGVLDCRVTPIKFYGHAVGFQDGRVRVRIARSTYEKLKPGLIALACRWSLRRWERFIREEWPRRYQPWPGVRDQFFHMLREINRERRRGGREKINWRLCFQTRRKVLKVFPETPKNPAKK